MPPDVLCAIFISDSSYSLLNNVYMFNRACHIVGTKNIVVGGNTIRYIYIPFTFIHCIIPLTYIIHLEDASLVTTISNQKAIVLYSSNHFIVGVIAQSC